MTTNTPEVNQEKSDATRTGISRRRVLTASGGVLLAVQAKTALGTAICQSPSAMVSGNTSPRQDGPPPCSGGRSPGFWRNPQKFNAWVSPAVHPTLKNVSLCPTGLGKISPANIETQGTPVLSVFPDAAALLQDYIVTDKDGNVTLNIQASTWGIWAVLAFPKLVGINEGDLLWHLCAAYLNSLAFDDYALTTAQVIEAGAALLTGGTWCPSSINSSVCASNAFTGESFKAYISGMYHINSDLDITAWCTNQ
ncbi:MAG: hypothetical protein KDG55_15840 [Rhodocyclaceae bacterium]|nr:hypothetical protein [Rhodocyclaceae bacterium]